MSVEEAAEVQQRYGEYAGFATRLVAFVIDIAVLIAVATVIGLTTSLLNQFLGFAQGAERLLAIIAGLLTLSVNVGYFMVFWMLVGMTPGMRIMGLLLITEEGGRITIGVAIRRYVGYFLSAILLVGYLWVLIDPRRQGFHDKLAGTLVIYDWPDDLLASHHETRVRRARVDALAQLENNNPSTQSAND